MTAQQALQFHPLSFVEEGEDVVVGRIDTGAYAVLPADGARLLQRMSEGQPPSLAANWYLETFGEPVDIDDFLEAVTELGFIRADGDELAVLGPPRLRWLGKALFSRVAFVCYGLLALAWAVLAIPHPSIRPAASQLFFVRSVVVVQLAVLFGQLPFIGLHESFHVLAGQRAGLHSKLNVSNRFTYVVFETQSNGLLSLPRRQRYLPFLAGMLFDAVAFCALDLIAQYTRTADGALSTIGRLCVAFSFAILTRLGWQFLLYLRTDLYFVLATALNCHDLHDASKALVMNRLWRLLNKPHRLIDETQWTDRDLKVARWYGWFLLLGALTILVITAFVTVPVLYLYLKRLASGLVSGQHTALFWDAVLSVVLNLVSFVVPAYLSRRKRRLNAGRGPRLANPGVV